MIEARHVDVLAVRAVILLVAAAVERRHVPLHVEANLLAQIAADHVGAVADAVRISVRISS